MSRTAIIAVGVIAVMCPAAAQSGGTWLADRQAEFSVWQAAHPGRDAQVADLKARTAALIARQHGSQRDAVRDRELAAPSVILRVKGAVTHLWDSPMAPRMTIIPAGDFTMGSPESEPDRRKPEGPQHRVHIDYPLAVGTYQVTRDEYAAFVADTKRPDPDTCYAPDAAGKGDFRKGVSWHNPGFAQSGRDPVVCVSWEDGRDYATWLSQKTGRKYRLLSEAEWEYAARAGTQTVRYWGNGIARGNANYGADEAGGPFAQGTDRWAHTSPGGGFPPNAFGLYDMMGNAWQRVDDCWNPTFDGAPTDGSSWQTGDCATRTGHGGAFDSQPSLLRSAMRGSVPNAAHFSDGTFRIAREL